MKSNRRKRQERQRRRAHAAQRIARREREAVLVEALRAAEERAERMIAPETPPTDVADLLLDTYGADDVPTLEIARVMAVRGDVGHVHAVRDALTTQAPGSVLARAFAVEVARAVDEDPAEAGRLLHALARDGDVPREWLAAEWVKLHRPGEAVEAAAEALREDVDDRRAQAWYAAALAMAAEQPAEDADPRARAALEAFRGDDRLATLREALQAWVAQSPWAKEVDEFVADWLDALPETVASVADEQTLATVAIQHAWLVAGEDGDEDSDTPIARFAADPATPPDLAALAREWQETVHYGLWQVADPGEGGPGTWLTDIVSGATRYAALGADRRAALARWSVLLGALVRCDGVWRPAGGLIVLTPREGDALAEIVSVMTESVIEGMRGRRSKAARRAARPAPFDDPKPHGVLADEADPVPADIRRFLGMVVGAGLDRLLDELAAHRAAPAQLRNTDGDPLCLVKARIAVADTADVLGRLGAHPDFGVDEDDPARLTWWGRELSTGEGETMRAQAAAELGVDARELADPDLPQRWVRGTLRLEGDQFVIEVNSRERLDRLLEALSGLGAAPQVLDRSVVDPAQDMVLPTGPLVLSGGAPEAHEAWQRHWLDEPVPALRHRTPRQAAQREEDRPYLEALLRQFEHEADLVARAGGTGPDIGWLREHLDMPADGEES